MRELPFTGKGRRKTQIIYWMVLALAHQMVSGLESVPRISKPPRRLAEHSLYITNTNTILCISSIDLLPKSSANHGQSGLDMKKYKVIGLFGLFVLTTLACNLSYSNKQSAPPPPHEARWGIYSLDLTTQEVELIHSSLHEITNLRLNPGNDRFAFSQKVAGDTNEDSEIFTLGVDGDDLRRLTNNSFLDTYPVWSPTGSQIAYLSWPDATLDIYIMAIDSSQSSQFYDSGYHDADIDWVNDLIVFTRNSQIWIINSDGSEAHQLTAPPRAGEWGNANLPFGDYDPRISPDGSKVVFERMLDDSSPHGNYDLFTINIDGTNLSRITDSGFTQGLANWSTSGTQIAYIVTAIDDVGQYDIYLINPDGSENRKITPTSFPVQFLIHGVIFSGEDTLFYFIGEWWSEK